MTAETAAGASRSARRRLVGLSVVLIALAGLYAALPKSWFEVPDPNRPVGPAATPSRASTPGPSVPSLEEMRAVVAREPLDYQARSRFGMALAAAGRNAEALEEFLAAARLSPDSPVVHHNLGVFYLNTGRLREADAAFSRELETAPGDATAHHYRGVVLQGLRRSAKAQAQFRLAIALAPQFPDPYLSLATEIAGSQPSAAVRDLIEQYVRLGGDSTVANFVMSRAHRERKEYAEAARYAEMTTAANPNSYAYSHNLGTIYSYAGRTADAERTLLHAATLTRDPSTVFIELGMNAEKAGRYADAVAYFNKGLAANPAIGNIHLYLSRAYQRAGNMASSRAEEATFREWERRSQAARHQAQLREMRRAPGP